jgi:SAM-dependent methyltransferase
MKTKHELKRAGIMYWYQATCRRRFLDRWLGRHQHLFRGTVLDIGGRDRGRFRKPKGQVQKWIFADIEAAHHPDVVLDVTRMQAIHDTSIDVVLAMELFEHVNDVNKGLEECYRVLKPGGACIISAPFLYPIHGDPMDFQRWTEQKWQTHLTKSGFTVERIDVTGRYFMVLGDMLRDGIKTLPRFVRILFLPWLFLTAGLVWLDDFPWVRRSPRLGRYHAGYCIIARRPA